MVSDAHENWTSKGEIDRDVLKLGFNHLKDVDIPFDRDSIIEYIEAFLANLDKIKNPSGAGETSTMTRNSLKRNKNVKDEHAFAVVLSTMSERK